MIRAACIVAVCALAGCAGQQPVPAPVPVVVAMPPIPNPPPEVTPAPKPAPIARQLEAADKRALSLVVQPDADAAVIKALRKLDKQARQAVRAAERHPTQKALEHAHEAVSALDDYLVTQGAP